MEENFRDYTVRQLHLDSLKNGSTLPEPSGAPQPASYAKNAVDAWFATKDLSRRRSASEKQASDHAFKERTAPLKKAKRKEANTARRRAKRHADAAAEGVALRTRTDCSKMSAEERLVHKRTVDRNRKRRLRATEPAAMLSLPAEMLEILEQLEI
jgi:hypothetical protein